MKPLYERFDDAMVGAITDAEQRPLNFHLADAMYLWLSDQLERDYVRDQLAALLGVSWVETREVVDLILEAVNSP